MFLGVGKADVGERTERHSLKYSMDYFKITS